MWTLRRVIAATATMIVVAVIAAITLAPWSRVPAEAFLGELAEATRTISQQDLPDGSYIYIASDELVSGDSAAQVGDDWVYVDYLLPLRVERWLRDDTEQRITTVGQPTFFDAEMENFYYSNGLDQSDYVGEARTEFFSGVVTAYDPSDWSTDPTLLAAQMGDAAAADPSAFPIDVKMVELAERLLDPAILAPPALRAAVLDVLADLDLDEERLANGNVRASITYPDPGFGTVTKSLTFGDGGYLIGREIVTLTGGEERTLPPGTVFESLTQTPPIVVAEPGLRPDGQPQPGQSQ